MDRDAVDAHLRGLDALVGEPPPMLTLVVLANGSGIAFGHDWLTGSLDDPQRLEEARQRLTHFLALVGNVDQLLATVRRIAEEGR